MRWTSTIGVGGISDVRRAALAIAAPASTGPRTAPAPTPRPRRRPSPTWWRPTAPLDIAWRADDPVPYVVEQGGDVLRLADDGTLTSALDLADLTSVDGEQGLLGLTFTAAGDLAYVDYTDLDGTTTIVEYPVLADGTPRPGHMRTLLVIEQPYPNHNGGDVAIGPDGMLYIGMGDGGSGGDPERRALDLSSLLGKLLRIDPTPSARPGLHDPADNPFVGDRRRPRRDLVDRAAQPVAVLVRLGHRRPVDRRRRPERHRGGRRGRRHRRARRRQGGRLRLERVRGQRPLQRRRPRPTTTPPFYTYPHGARCSICGGVRARGAGAGRSTGGTCSATTAPAR